MRISDWSSDLGTSDLRLARVYVPWRRAPLEPWPQMTSGDPFEAPAVVVELLAGAGAFQHQVRTLPAIVGKLDIPLCAASHPDKDKADDADPCDGTQHKSTQDQIGRAHV